MYGIVLIAAMTSAGPGCHCQSGPVLCCPVTCGCCGVIHFHWVATSIGSAISPSDSKLWNTYLDALTQSERADVLDLWKRSDDAGRQKLIAQIKAMRVPTKDRELDREVRKQTRSSDQFTW